VARAVHEERRRAFDATDVATGQVTLDTTAELRRGAVAVEPIGLETQVDGVLV
jgi:hypothetical protein